MKPNKKKTKVVLKNKVTGKKVVLKKKPKMIGKFTYDVNV